MTHAEAMDRMYRLTRHVYDFTRKYYLLGRDQLLREMMIRPGDNVLEIGCGTARNLIILSRKHPEAHFYGLDASNEMLDTARKKVQKAALSLRIHLAHGLAEKLDHQQTFNLPAPFDVIFFSYSLSMIPTWPQAIEAALDNLRPGGALYIVDFWDQGGLPGPFQYLLQSWLLLFHVRFRPELLNHLQNLEARGHGQFELRSIRRRYAYFGTLRKNRALVASSKNQI